MTPEELEIYKAVAVAGTEKSIEEVGKLMRHFIDLLSGTMKSHFEARHMMIIADGKKQTEKIVAGTHVYEKGKAVPIVEKDMVLPTIHGGIQQEETKNLFDCFRVTANVLSNTSKNETADEKTPYKKVPPSTFAKWRREAGIIEDTKIQDLWGKILAGEIKSPGSFSVRSLDILKNISTEEAKLFSKISPLIADKKFLIMCTLAENESIISFDDLLLLEECGLLTSHQSAFYTYGEESPQPSYAFALHNKFLFVETRSNFQMPCIQLTKAGMNILSIADIPDFTEEHKNHLFSNIIKQNIGGKYYKNTTSIDNLTISELRENGTVKKVLYSNNHP